MASFPAVTRFGQLASMAAAGFALLLGAASCPAFADWRQEQQSSQQSSGSRQSSQTQAAPAQPATPPLTNPQYSDTEKKTRKIWTEDDLIALRTPMDIYLLEKEAREAAEAEAEAAAEAAAQKASDQKAAAEDKPTIDLPPTIEATQDLIKSKQQQVDDEQNGLERMTNQLPNTPEDQKPALQKEIDRVTADLPKTQLELKQLQDHLDALTKAQLNAPPPAENPPPPSNPQP